MKDKSKIIIKKIYHFIKENIRIIIAFVAVILFIEIVEDIFKNEIFAFDNRLYHLITLNMSEGLNNIFKILTNMGAAIILIPICIIMFIILKKKRYATYITINLAVATILNIILKQIFVRPRPTELRIISETGYSFPSGHSMVSMAFYGFLIYLAYTHIKNNKLKWSICIALSIVIILVGISRIYLGVHYASDVCGGFLISIAYLMLYTKVIKTIDTKLKNKE